MKFLRSFISIAFFIFAVADAGSAANTESPFHAMLSNIGGQTLKDSPKTDQKAEKDQVPIQFAVDAGHSNRDVTLRDKGGKKQASDRKDGIVPKAQRVISDFFKTGKVDLGGKRLKGLAKILDLPAKEMKASELLSILKNRLESTPKGPGLSLGDLPMSIDEMASKLGRPIQTISRDIDWLLSVIVASELERRAPDLGLSAEQVKMNSWRRIILPIPNENGTPTLEYQPGQIGRTIWLCIDPRLERDTSTNGYLLNIKFSDEITVRLRD